MTEKRHEAARSGWCLCADHDRCGWSGCHCSCHVCDGCPFDKGCETCEFKGGK